MLSLCFSIHFVLFYSYQSLFLFRWLSSRSLSLSLFLPMWVQFCLCPCSALVSVLFSEHAWFVYFTSPSVCLRLSYLLEFITAIGSLPISSRSVSLCISVPLTLFALYLCVCVFCTNFNILAVFFLIHGSLSWQNVEQGQIIELKISKISVSNDISFVSLFPYLQQYFREDCKALAVTIGVGMNLVPILADSNTKARIGTLFLSDLAHIMALLSDDGAGQVLEFRRKLIIHGQKIWTQIP